MFRYISNISRLATLKSFVQHCMQLSSYSLPTSNNCQQTLLKRSPEKHLSCLPKFVNYSSVPAAVTSEQDDLYSLITIELKGHDTSVLESYQTFISMAACELNVSFRTRPAPRYAVQRFTLLKSVHVYKKHFRQYEIRTHFRTIEVKQLTGSTASTFLEYVQRNIPDGVVMKVTRHKCEVLPEELKTA